MPGCIVSAMTASFRSVEKRRRRATPVMTSTFENVSDIGVCLGLYLGPPAKAGVRSKQGAVHRFMSWAAPETSIVASVSGYENCPGWQSDGEPPSVGHGEGKSKLCRDTLSPGAIPLGNCESRYGETDACTAPELGSRVWRR